MSRQRRWSAAGRRTVLTLVVTLCMGLQIWGVGRLDVLHRLDDLWHDWQLKATMPATPDRRIVIVDVDESSLSQLGQWPWPRQQVAALVQTLFEQHHIASLGFDMVFAEDDLQTQLMPLKNWLQQQALAHPEWVASAQKLMPELAKGTQSLAQVLAQYPVVLGYYFTSDRAGAQHGQLPAATLSAQPLLRAPYATQWSGYGANQPDLAAAAKWSGHFNAMSDADGVVRSVPLLAVHNGQYYEALSLALFRSTLGGASQVSLLQAPKGQGEGMVSGIEVRQAQRVWRMPLDARLGLRVPYRHVGGPQAAGFEYVSAADVMFNRLKPNALAHKTVLLGSTAPGLMDLRVTPVASAFPGVEVHANLLSAMLDQHFLVEPDYAIGYEFAVALVLGLVLMVWLPRLSAGRALWLCAVLASVVVGGQSWLYVRHGLVLPVVSSVCLIAVAFVLNMVDGYWIEGRSKRQLARLFGTYVPPELVQKMVQAPADYTMQASSKELTVMFCDMHGFTHLAETLSPVQLQQLLNRTLSMLTHIIGQHHGTIDKYMGDCVMAFWGAPVANPLHASQAVQAGLAIEQAMVSLNAQHAALQLPPIKVGIGINTGSMLVGDMGSDIRRSYTVVGDAVNLAARLESLSRTYGCTMLVGQATQQQTPNVAWQWLDRVQVKGKDDAVRIYAPSSATPQELELWAQCLLAYGQQEWVLCLHCLHDLAQRPGVQGTGRAHLYDLYAQRVAQFQVRPPPQPWQGVMRYVH